MVTRSIRSQGASNTCPCPCSAAANIDIPGRTPTLPRHQRPGAPPPRRRARERSLRSPLRECHDREAWPQPPPTRRLRHRMVLPRALSPAIPACVESAPQRDWVLPSRDTHSCGGRTISSRPASSRRMRLPTSGAASLGRPRARLRARGQGVADSRWATSSAWRWVPVLSKMARRWVLTVVGDSDRLIGDRRWATSVREQARDGGFSGGEAVELSKDGRLGQRIAIWVHDDHQRCGTGRDDADRAAIDRQHTCRT